jgi:hypothetical protein
MLKLFFYFEHGAHQPGAHEPAGACGPGVLSRWRFAQFFGRNFVHFDEKYFS